MNATTTAPLITPSDIPGEYYLRGVPEVGSGFKLDANNHFEFFVSYGALDRYGAGQWIQEKGIITFQSRAWSGKDFALLKSSKTADTGITIRIHDDNQMVLRYMHASLQKGAKESWEQADEQGVIRFPTQRITDIALLFEFCPERFSLFTVDTPDHNYFEFRIEPWLVEYFFNDFSLTITEDGFKGRHPMLTGNEYVYVKSNG